MSEEKFLNIIKEFNLDSGCEVTMDTLLSELLLDSIEEVNLIMKLEEEFQVSFELDQELTTVGDIYKRVCHEQEKK